MSIEFVTALIEWLPMQEAAAYRALRNVNSTERECDRARGQLDVIEKVQRCLVTPATEFGDLWPLNEETEDEDDDGK